MSRLQRNLLIVTIILAGLAFWANDLARPFAGHFDLSNAVWTVYADNFVRYGPIDARLGDVGNIEPAALDDLNYTQHHHPYMMTYFMLPGRILFGPAEFGTRVMPLAVSLLAAAALYLLAERLFPKTGHLALLFFMFTPVVMYYSNITTQGLLNLLWITVGLWLYSHWLADPSARWRNRLYLLALIGGWTDWEYYLFVIYMIVHATFAAGWKRSRQLWPQMLIFGITGVLFVLVNTWQIGWDAFWIDFLGGISMRLTNTAANRSGFPGLGDFVLEMFGRQFTYFTPILFLLGVTGGVMLLASWRGRRSESDEASRLRFIQQGLPLLPLLTTLTFMVFLREAHWIHDFLLYHLVLPYALWGAYTFRQMFLRLRQKRQRLLEPLWVSLLVVFVVLGVMLFQVRRMVDHWPERAAWGKIVAGHIEPGEAIAGNIGYSEEHYPIAIGNLLAYYAGVNENASMWVTPPEQLQAGDAEVDFYVYCPPTMTGHDAPTDPPDWLREMAVEAFEKGGCWFLDLQE